METQDRLELIHARVHVQAEHKYVPNYRGYLPDIIRQTVAPRKTSRE